MFKIINCINDYYFGGYWKKLIMVINSLNDYVSFYKLDKLNGFFLFLMKIDNVLGEVGYGNYEILFLSF